MMKAFRFRFGIFLLVFALLCPYISLAAEEDMKLSKQVSIDFSDDVCGEYSKYQDLDFLIKDGNLFVDAEEFLKLLGFNVFVKNDNELNFISKGEIDEKIGDIYDFSRMNAEGTFFLGTDDVFYSIIKPKAVELKSPVKSFVKDDKAWIPFSFTLDLLNLDLDETNLEDCFYIKRKPVDRIDVMLVYKYLLESPRVFKWKDIHGDGYDRLFRDASRIIYLDRILSKDIIDALAWDRAAVRDSLKSMMLFKEKSNIDKATYELEADLAEKVLKGAEYSRYLHTKNAKKFIKLEKFKNSLLEPMRDYFDYAESKGVTRQEINAVASNIATFYKLYGEYKTELKNINSDLSKAFASYYKDKVDREKSTKKNNFDSMALSVLETKFIPDTVIDKLPDIVSIISNEKTLNAGLDYSVLDPSDFIDLGHEGIKFVFKKYFDLADAFNNGTYSNIMSENIRLDFLNNYYKLDPTNIGDDEMLRLSNTFYLALVSKYTTNNYILETIIANENPSKESLKNKKKAIEHYEKENMEIIQAIDDFEKAKKLDKDSKYNFDKLMINPDFNKAYVKNYDDSKLVGISRSYNDSDRVTNVIAEFTSETQGDSTYEVMVLKGVNPDGDIMWTNSVKSQASQMPTLKLLQVGKDYFYYASSDGVFKASMTDGSTIWVNSDGAAVVDSALGKDGRLYLTMGIAYKFQVIDKDGKTLKLIKDFDEVLPMREYGFYELGKVKLINDKLYIELFMGDSVPNEKERYMEMNVSDYSLTLPDFGIYTTYSELGNDGHEAYHDIINNESPDDYVYCEYGYVDIDDDGSDELVIHKGENEVSRTYTFYTLVGGKPVKLGEVEGWHSAVYKNGNRLIKANGEGDYGDFVIISCNKRQKVITTSKQNKYARGTAEFYFGEPIRYRKIE